MDFEHLAQLSRLAFTETEKKQMEGDMADVIALMDEIQAAPGIKASRSPYAHYENLRQDCVKQKDSSGKRERFCVPKVVG